MSTLADGMTDATAELKVSRIALDAAADLLRNKSASAQAVIDGFVGRPAVTNIFVDPVDGNDANNGATVNTPRKSLDDAIGGIASNATAIFLLNDATMRRRAGVNAPLTISGIQKAANANGYITYTRTITFLGTAENSPLQGVGTVCAGLFFNGPTFRVSSILFALPDVPAGLDYRNHFTSLANLAVSVLSGTVTVSSPQAGSLFGVNTARLTATLTLALGSGAAGHVFEGVAAGGNPNAQYQYTSNLNSA